jgi:hypothetical protein
MDLDANFGLFAAALGRIPTGDRTARLPKRIKRA